MVTNADTAAAAPGISGKERVLRAVLSALASQRGGARLSAGLAGDAAPASLTQQQLWMLERLEPGEPINNLSVAYRLRGHLSVERLRAALDQAVARHAVLRTRFELSGTRLLQCAQQACAVLLKIDTLSDTARYGQAAEDSQLSAHLRAWAQEQALVPFADGEVPLLRPALLVIGPGDHLLVLTVHHLAFDGWSFDILMRELCASYAGSATPPWPEQAPCYADYAAWQRARLASPAAAAAREFWREQLRHAPAPVRLPADARGRASLVRRGARHRFVIDNALAGAVEALGERSGSTGFMVYLAAYLALLHRRTMVEDLVVGFPIANRCLSEIREMIGPFAQLFPVRTAVGGGDRFDELLQRVRDTVLGAYVHQGYPLSEVVEGNGPGGYPGGAVQCNFAYQNVPHSDWGLPGLEVEAWDVGNGCASGDLALFVWQDGAGMGAYLEYDCERFEAATMQAFADQYLRLLRSATRDERTEVAALNLGATDPAERERLREWGLGRGSLAPAAAVHEAFRAQASATPDAAALICGEGRLSYAQLDRVTDMLARRLLSLWPRPAAADRADEAQVIAFKLPASLERLVLLLAILKAGAAYLPLKHDAPQAYADELLAEAGAVCVVVEDAAAWSSATEVRSLRDLFEGLLFGGTASGGEDLDAVVLPNVAPQALACLMYTSGSTGRAKGVRIIHRGIVALTRAPSYLPPIQGETFLQLAPIAFDASSFEIWGALLNGGCLVLPGSDKPSLKEIAEAITAYDVGVLWLSSGLFQVLLEAHPHALASLRLLLVGGDVVSVEHVRRYLSMPCHGLLYNGYGPTENTTFTTAHPIDAEPADPSTGVSIGRPIAGDCLRVLDASGQPVPIGVVGEACVGGVGLMLGYQRSDSDRHWISDPFAPRERLYRTGDAVRWRSDGCLDFIGRLDHQLKLRGFRIEPAQVETELHRSELVRACAVGASERDGRAVELVAAVVPADTAAEPSVVLAELRGFLGRRLPDYLIPARMVVVAELPLTANGKVDRRALARLVADAPQQAAAICAPRNGDEATIHAAFARALGHGRFGVYDDFFSAGGDSLAALLLLSRLERELGARVSLADLFELRTVAALAAQLDRDVGPEQARELPDGVIEIKRGDGRLAPTFLMPGGKGGRIEMTLYAELMRHVGGEAVGYGFITQPPSERPHALAERARIYVERMRSLQPQGPYCLVGECIGGIAAFEMAQQLRREGQRVALLLVDSWCPSRAGTLHYYVINRPQAVMAGAIEETRVYLRQALVAAKQAGSAAMARRLPGIAWRTARLGAGLLLRMFHPERARAGDAADADFDYVRQAMAYRPEIYPGDVTFIASEGNRKLGIAEQWREWVGGEFRVLSVPGDHDSYLRKDVATTARALRSLLDDVAAGRADVPHRSAILEATNALSGVRV